jgi:hypothetical protein
MRFFIPALQIRSLTADYCTIHDFHFQQIIREFPNKFHTLQQQRDTAALAS